ncbi:MAG: tRNA 2-thiouridine(34) synthase MnmA [Desulfobacteraceae bacterium]|nr:tRNA 2-thiouridine(34) synthase MnmA [Desulfobacteraceae bacterium]
MEQSATIAVAMSGGVDSLCTAALLKERGYEVFGVHMRLFPLNGNCLPGQEAAGGKDCSLAKLAARLDIPLFFVDLQADFEELVIRPFVEAYLEGLTPNPCVLCNPRIKFGRLLQEARRSGAQRLATGHYARILPPDASSPRFRLCRAADPAKDQSYFLYNLTQEQLASAVLPLGSSLKRDVKLWAEEAGFSGFIPEESQEICFIPSGSYQEFLADRAGMNRPPAAGPIVDVNGKVLGEHRGIFAYTVGQRRGLGIPSSAPYYVVALEPATNTVRIGRADDLFCREFTTTGVSWLSISRPDRPLRCHVRIRNQHRPAPACVSPLGEHDAVVRFEQPQRAVTPGQAAVFYDGDVLLGGGTIVMESHSE